MSRLISIAAIGCSTIADRYALNAIRNSSTLQLTCVASRSTEKATKFAKRFSCRPASYEDAIQSQDIDAVYISLPAALHAEWAKKALSSGKHVLVEKTFSDSLSSATEVIGLARSKKLIVAEALMYVFHPLLGKVKEILASGRIGKLRHIEGRFGFPTQPLSDIRNNRLLGGGAILDTSVYPLSLALELSPNPHRAIHISVSKHEQFDVDGRGTIQMDWPDHSATLIYGFGLSYRNGYTLWGEKGRMEVDRGFSRPPDLPGEITIVENQTSETISVPAADQFQLMMDNFGLKIIGKDSSGVNEGPNILRRMEIIEQLLSRYRKEFPSS